MKEKCSFYGLILRSISSKYQDQVYLSKKLVLIFLVIVDQYLVILNNIDAN